MQFWVYLLRCADGSYYAGHTDNLEGRLWQHQQGICCDWTSRRRPVELVWCEAAPTREEALAFEQRIKRWTRAKKEALIAGNWDRISWLARPPRERPSTSLRTNEPDGTGTTTAVRAERSAARAVEARTRTVRAERSAQRAVEARLPQPPEQRPSTSLRTNEPDGTGTTASVRAERSAQRVVEARVTQPPKERPSPALATDDQGARP